MQTNRCQRVIESSTKPRSFAELVNGDKPVLIDFTAAWCGTLLLVHRGETKWRQSGVMPASAIQQAISSFIG